ncbi:tetratricopeptide repeat protein [Luteolibacter luteus]|uniref:Tetratricopeptide repeat protein n=1 Tax=Luteolibacter luteus TaxID=2728835 RepID=A0A858RM40_9BACT|nr:tetratricopeptide repeat protein [Luteolibacter luteus]QJE97564.1 tetratricopeptide repeat protein [Luteolibacter luteus]
MEKLTVPRHLLSAFLLSASPVWVMAQEPAPAPAGQTVAPAVLNKLFEDAEAAFASKDYATAAAKIDELLKALGNKKEASSEMLHFNLGLAHLLAENYEAAEKAFTDCIVKFPNGEYTSRCYLGVGTAAIKQGGEEKQNRATEALRKAALDPKYRTQAGLLLGQLYTDTNKHEEALKVFRSLMGSDIQTPEQTQAAVEVIGLLADTGQLADLIAYLDRIINQPGIRDAIAWYSNQVIVKGDELVGAENYEAALAIYRSIPPRAQILQIQAATLAAKKQELGKLENLAKAEEKKPLGQRSNVGERLNQTQSSIKLTEEAIAAIEKLTDLDAALLMRRGRCFYYLDRNEEALLCFRTLREKYPTAKDAQSAAYAEIVIYNGLKDTDKIQTLANEFLTKYPDAPNVEQVATLAGEVLVQTGKWDQVLKYYQDLEKRFPNSPSLDRFVFFQGVALFQSGDFQGSAAHFENFIKTYPDNRMVEDAVYRIAMAYFLTNNYEKTLFWCRDYLNKYPDGRYAGDMLYRLAFVDFNDKTEDQSQNIIKSLGDYLEKKPDDAAAGSMYCLMADTWKKMKSNDPATAKTYEDNALANYIKAVWSDSPDDVIQYALETATTILQGRKDWDGLAKLHEEFLSKRPNHQMAMISATWVAKAMARQGKEAEGAEILSKTLSKSIADPSKEQVEFLIDEIVKSLTPRRRPKDLDVKALEQQLVDMLDKAAEGKENQTTYARIYYARARMMMILKETQTANDYLRNLAMNTDVKAADLSPTLLALCADILMKSGDLDRAEENFKRLAERYKDSPFSDAGPVGLGQIALLRKQPDQALAIFKDALENNNGTSRFKEATLGKLEAMYDLGQNKEVVELADKIIKDRSFKGGPAVPKAYIIWADTERKIAKDQPPSESIATLKAAYARYERVWRAYQRETDLFARSLWGSYEVAKDLGNNELEQQCLKALAENPKLQNTEEAKKAKTLVR